ncbi:MAG TPA: aminotransferase class V-fold PLP-dependent enzyme [Acidobacteriota bacterium]|nr:aminotransferase class V-fold PLP-dependent enzyme [Acidobacteriota bacterium]
MGRSDLNRRELTRLFAFGGSAALLGHPSVEGFRAAPLSVRPGAVAWDDVRSQFLMPPDVSVLNAANLCPAPASVLKTVAEHTERLDREPFPSYRSEITGAKERTRELLAEYLRVTPEEILIPRNTSEANNWVSNGLDLGPGDEILIFSENHPSNNRAWKGKAKRFGYTVREVEPVTPHPGMEYYVEAFERAITPNTRVMTFMHQSNTVGELFPAKELCAMAHDRGVISLIDGAQSFGLLDVDLSDLQPDFYSGSAHKWPCGPKETGVLYVNARVQDRFWPSSYSAHPGETGISSTHEGMGQRDTPALHAFGTQIEFLQSIGQREIEARSRQLTTWLIEGLNAIDGVHMWTPAQPELRASVVRFWPGELDPGRVLEALEEDGIVAAAGSNPHRGGVRFSPHFYNTEADIERAIDAIGRYMRQGL